MIALYLLILAAGFVALVKGADIFVDGSAALARNFRVPSLIIGLTIVAMGTSAPELAVSTSAALQGANEIALSNVVGSNIVNLLGVLGACAVVSAVPVSPAVMKRDLPFSVAVTLLVFFAAAGGAFFGGAFLSAPMDAGAGMVTRLLGAVLLLLFTGYILFLVRDARRNPREEEEEGPGMANSRCALLILIGIALIVAGGQAVVRSARAIAEILGMSETLIGLTIVAIGTSLPELVTSLVAARKGETELAVGNAVGSNIFNMLLILGVSSVIHPVAVNIASVWDMLLLLGASLLTCVFALSSRRIVRAEGIAMVLCYFGIMAFAILR